MGVTSDPTDPRLTHGADPAGGPPVRQAPVYLVLPDRDRATGRVRPLRHSYWHTTCGQVTTMSTPIAETYACRPGYYGATFCATCRLHRPVGVGGEFFWCDDDDPGRREPGRQPKVGT